MATNVGTGLKAALKEDDKGVKTSEEEMNAEGEERRVKIIAEEAESQKPAVNRERAADLQLDLEKCDRDSSVDSLHANKLSQHVQKQQHQQTSTEKTALAGSLPLPMSVAGWPGGLPPMGYMAPLQGVVSMDGSTLPSAAIQPQHLLFTQPRPKRCATHCYIARNIHHRQQFMKMNPFWPAIYESLILGLLLLGVQVLLCQHLLAMLMLLILSSDCSGTGNRCFSFKSSSSSLQQWLLLEIKCLQQQF